MGVISFQQNKNNRLFVKKEHDSLKFVLCLLLSLILMVCDHRYHCLGRVKSIFSYCVTPLQFTVDYPVRVFAWMHALITSKKKLIDENISLHYQHMLLQAELQKFLAIEKENSQLKELLQTSSKTNMRAMAAQILAVDAHDAQQIIILNKGKRDGVYLGQPVLDAQGVMGQIIDSGPLTSTVLLISDARSAVPVRNHRTGECAILVGTHSKQSLSLVNLPKTSSIHPQDLLVTSGLDRKYPEGYPVGRVVQVNNVPGEDFITVSVSPIARLNQDRLVLLIWPDPQQEELTAQINKSLAQVAG